MTCASWGAGLWAGTWSSDHRDDARIRAALEEARAESQAYTAAYNTAYDQELLERGLIERDMGFIEVLQVYSAQNPPREAATEQLKAKSDTSLGKVQALEDLYEFGAE